VCMYIYIYIYTYMMMNLCGAHERRCLCEARLTSVDEYACGDDDDDDDVHREGIQVR
jgi:hypothetical protein